MMTLERRRDLIAELEPHFLPQRLRSTKRYFIKATDHSFYGFTGVISHLGCWENTRKACKSRAEMLNYYMAESVFAMRLVNMRTISKKML